MIVVSVLSFNLIVDCLLFSLFLLEESSGRPGWFLIDQCNHIVDCRGMRTGFHNAVVVQLTLDGFAAFGISSKEAEVGQQFLRCNSLVVSPDGNLLGTNPPPPQWVSSIFSAVRNGFSCVKPPNQNHGLSHLWCDD